IESCGAFGRAEGKPIAQAADVGGKALSDVGATRKFDEKVLIIRGAAFEKRSGRLPSKFELLLHAVADVENDSEAHRRDITGKVADLLLDFVFEHLEVFGGEAGDESVVRVVDAHIEQHQVDIDLQGLLRRKRRRRNNKYCGENENLRA